jgi:hypothetical protein
MSCIRPVPYRIKAPSEVKEKINRVVGDPSEGVSGLTMCKYPTIIHQMICVDLSNFLLSFDRSDGKSCTNDLYCKRRG